MASFSGGSPIIDVERINDALYVEVCGGVSMDDFREFGSPKDTIITNVEDITYDVNTDVRHETLFYFHQCLGHLSYDNIIEMARNPAFFRSN